MSEREEALLEAADMLESWAAADEREGEADSAGALRNAAACVRELRDPTAKGKCACPGCEDQVPRFWRCGLCVDCANEDCDHEEA